MEIHFIVSFLLHFDYTDCYDLDGVNDAHEYLATRRAMEIVRINEEEQVAFL